MALLDRRPWPDAVERHHEAEGLAGEVVGGAGADEAEVGLGEADLLENSIFHRHQHLDFVGVRHRSRVLGLTETDDRHISHWSSHPNSPGCCTSASGSLLGRKY